MFNPSQDIYINRKAIIYVASYCIWALREKFTA